LFLFVVMLLNVPREEPAPPGVLAVIGARGLRVGALLSLVLGIEIVWALSRVGSGWFGQDASATSVSSVALIGQSLFTRHAFAFEATSILILVAMVGAVVIARRER
jgi:NADH-quinone oxidoreductase subunit J